MIIRFLHYFIFLENYEKCPFSFAFVVVRFVFNFKSIDMKMIWNFLKLSLFYSYVTFRLDSLVGEDWHVIITLRKGLDSNPQKNSFRKPKPFEIFETKPDCNSHMVFLEAETDSWIVDRFFSNSIKFCFFFYILMCLLFT